MEDIQQSINIAQQVLYRTRRLYASALASRAPQTAAVATQRDQHQMLRMRCSVQREYIYSLAALPVFWCSSREHFFAPPFRAPTLALRGDQVPAVCSDLDPKVMWTACWSKFLNETHQTSPARLRCSLLR